MNAKTVKLISPERVKILLENYGANPDAWPIDEKVSALSLIQQSGELRELQLEAAQLDRFLNEADVSNVCSDSENMQLVNNIIEILPEQERNPDPDYLFESLQHKKSLFDLNRSMGAIAASVAILVISMSIVTLKPDNISTVSSTAAQAALDGWMWEQVVGESSEDAEDPLTMMALLELEEL